MNNISANTLSCVYRASFLLLGVYIGFFVLTSTVLAAPIVPGSFSTTWDTADGVLSNLGLGTCADSVYWEEIGNESNNGTDNSCDGFSRTTVTVSGPGQYRVDYSGSFTRVQFSDQLTKDEFRSVEQWGNGQWNQMNNAFSGMSSISINAVDIPLFAPGANLIQMFRQSVSFNDDISNWDVSNVTQMNGMFDGATSFNIDISGWDVSNVTQMDSMFAGATAFNQNLSSWNVSSVTNMQAMFAGATSFNIDISGWDVSSVQNFASSGEGGCATGDGMFFGASAFNQNLANWNIANANCLTDIFAGSNISTENYSAILIGWSALTVPTDIDLGTVPATYCDTAQAARDILTTTYSWIITDEGVTTTCAADEANNSGGSSGTRVGDRLKHKVSTNATSSTTAVGNEKPFFESVRTLIDHITKNEDKLDQLTPEESTKLIVMLREIIVYLLDLIPGV